MISKVREQIAYLENELIINKDVYNSEMDILSMRISSNRDKIDILNRSKITTLKKMK